MSLGLTLVIMTVEFEFLEEEGNDLLITVSSRGTVEFEFLEEEGNVLLIIVSLKGTDLKVGWHYGQKENKSHCCARQPQCSRLH